MYTRNYRRRLDAVFLLLILFLFFCLSRLLYIQFFRSSYLADIARKQHSLFMELEPRRGTIFDINLKPLAINITVDSLYAAPNEMSDDDKETAVRQVSQVLGMNQSLLRDRLSRKKSFVWIARKIPPEQSQAIKAMKIKGLGFVKESKRSYSNGYLASHIIGFAGLDNVGLAGIEMAFDQYLKGEPGWSLMLRDARQKTLDLSEKMVSPKDGCDVVLTIDEVIQYIAERELEKAVKTYRAKAGTIIVMNPHTGAILALANRPTFDLNDFASVNKDCWRNRAVCDLFEPGSVFKIVTAAGCIEEKKVSEEDRFFCENGSYKFAGHVLHDHTSHGWLNFREVIEMSSNIGTCKAAQILGSDLLYKYIRLFGFGSKLGVDLPGEIPGMIKDPRFWSKTSITAVPMGQEVGVTSIQLASMVSVIANGGQLMRPYVVSEVRDKFGVPIKSYGPHMINKVISLETAERVKKILQGVVEEGTGQLAKMKDLPCAGKTGTAQKLEPNGTYSHDQFMGSFIGFAPVDDPLVTIAVILDEPHPYYGGVASAPAFKAVAADTVKYLRQKQGAIMQISNETKTAN